MERKNKSITYSNNKNLNVELMYMIASARAKGEELLSVELQNKAFCKSFRNSASKILKGMKREGYIKLFIFENDLEDSEKMETVYMLNKFPNLIGNGRSESVIYVKL